MNTGTDVRFCYQHYYLKSSSPVCLPAPTSITTTSHGFDEDTTCFFKSWNADGETFDTKSYSAQCGFNDDGLKYCDV